MIPKVDFLSILLKNEAKTSNKSVNPHISYGKETEILGNPMFVDIYATIQVPVETNSPLYKLMRDKKKSKHIKVKIVQSTNASITKQISDQPHRWLSSGGILETYRSNDLALITKDLKDFEGGLVTKSLDELSDVVERKIDRKGKKTYFFPYKFSFEIPEELGGEKVEHLAYFAYACIDLDSLSQEKRFDPSRLMRNSNFSKNMIGQARKQIVIQSGKTKNTNQIFHKIDNKNFIWTGDVHYHGPENPGPNRYIGYMANHPDGTMGPKLKLASIPNNIVQDYRKEKDIKKINFDFSLLSEKEEMKFASSSKNKSIFGELYASIDKSDNIKYAFLDGIDRSMKVKNNCVVISLLTHILIFSLD